MTIHAITQYLEYTWKAKSRHGVHSPFVYDFIEGVLLDTGPIERKFIVENPGLALRFENIISRMAAYYNYRNILHLPLKNDNGQNGVIDMLLLNGEEPRQWYNEFNKYFSLLKNGSVVVIAGIHKTAGHTAAWNILYKHPEVRMSIDLYGIGLLFFREEFKVAQHFILKY